MQGPVDQSTIGGGDADYTTDGYDAGDAEGGGAASVDCCCCDPGYVTPVQQQPAPQPTVAPNAIDPNTGLPVGQPSGGDQPPAPIAAPVDPNAGVTPQQPGAGVPAPVDPATGQPAPAPQDPKGTAPAPTGPGQVATVPAAQLPTWPQWVQALADLGVDAANIEKIGSQQLTNQQLALVYMTIREEILRAGGTTGPDKPGDPAPTPTPKSAWSPAWEQKFTALGLTADEVAQVKALAEQSGADEAALTKLYDQVKAKPAWSPAWEQKFTALGMPEEMVAVYAQSGANAAGLEAAYAHAAERLEKFRADGHFDKLVAEKVPADQIWGIILADKPMTGEEIDKLVNAQHVENEPGWKKIAQMGISFIPGVELAQYAWGKKFLTGEVIDRSNPMNIAFAALSGLAAFTTVRGVLNVSRGLGAIKGGLPELTKAGVLTAGEGVSQSALGALQNMGTKQRLAAFIPFTKTHSAVVGWGHAEAAAKAFNSGAASSLLAAGKDGALQVATLGQVFDDVKTGAMSMQGARNAYIGLPKPLLPFKMGGAPLTLGGDGNVINVARNLHVGDGRSALLGMLEVGGQKVAMNPSWLQTAPGLVDDIAGISAAHLPGLGKLMAGNAANVLGATGRSNAIAGVLARVRPGPAEYFARMGKTVAHPDWYTTLATTAATEVGAGAAVVAAGGGVAASRAATAGVPGVVSSALAGTADDAATLGMRASGGAAAAPASATVTGAGDDVLRYTMPDGSRVVDRMARYRDAAGIADTSTSMQPWRRAVMPWEGRASQAVDVDAVVAASRRLDEVRAAAGLVGR